MNTRTGFALILCAIIVTLLTGCGGGGGSNDGSGRVVIGKVVDENGAPAPGATVRVDSSGAQATTLSQGDFRLVGVPDGVHRLTAGLSHNGTGYTGSTQTLLLSGANTTYSNVNIQISPSNRQAAITGNVHDPNGRPLRDARVFLGVSVSPDASSAASLVAFADINGNYRIENVPAPQDASGAGLTYTLTASLVGYQNSPTTVQNVQPGQTRRQDFTLTGSSNQAVSVPTRVSVFAVTEPSIGQRPYAVAQASASPSAAVYEQIRRALSPAYARLAAARRPAAKSQSLRQAHDVSSFGPYAVEMSVFFDNAQPDSLAGFRVYNSAGGGALTPYDFLQDPLANIYTDLDPFYVANQQYNFAVSAVNTDNSESGLSNVSSVTPLGLLTLNQPSAGSTVGNPVTLTWNPVSGAASYTVFLYTNGFPSADAQYQQSAAQSGTTYTLTSLASGDYYTVVAGATSDGTAVTVTPITKFHVP